MKHLFLLLGLYFLTYTTVFAQDFDFRSGDLLFQDIDCGPLCDAIEKVTPSINGKHFSHIGLVYVAGDSLWVIEAIEKKVKITPLSQFISRSTTETGQPKIMVGRLSKAYQYLNAKAIRYSLQQLEVPYDDAFLYGNGKYYCSELIYDAYKYANDNREFFGLYPMTFKNPETNKTDKAWKAYYQKLKMKVPEGKLGCNPGSIGIHNAVEIIKSFY